MTPTRKDRVEIFSRNGCSIFFSFSTVSVCDSTQEKPQDHFWSSFVACLGRITVLSEGSPNPFTEGVTDGLVTGISVGSPNPFTEGVTDGLVTGIVVGGRRASFKY